MDSSTKQTRDAKRIAVIANCLADEKCHMTVAAMRYLSAYLTFLADVEDGIDSVYPDWQTMRIDAHTAAEIRDIACQFVHIAIDAGAKYSV